MKNQLSFGCDLACSHSDVARTRQTCVCDRCLSKGYSAKDSAHSDDGSTWEVQSIKVALGTTRGPSRDGDWRRLECDDAQHE